MLTYMLYYVHVMLISYDNSFERIVILCCSGVALPFSCFLGNFKNLLFNIYDICIKATGSKSLYQEF